MSALEPCPCAEELKLLLGDSITDEERAECTRHLDGCVCCQRKLEELAAAGAPVAAWVSGANRDVPPPASEFWQAIASVRDTPSIRSTYVPAGKNRPSAKNGHTTRSALFEFLQPPNESQFLGRLAHFDVVRLIGRGGMGMVFEAVDSRLGRRVAIKVLDPSLAEDETAGHRFCRESRAAAAISHDNVVAVHQVEHDEQGVAYMVMQLVEGETLESRLMRERRLPLPEIVRIGLQVAMGLAAAHAQGLVHRDVKPANILLEGPSGKVKLSDFGLARATEDVRLTRTGFVPGTPLYMAPEQALGDAVDHRSDLFSLGAVLYEMATGNSPFAGGSALAVLKRITDEDPVPVQAIASDAPDWLADLIARLLQKSPANRFQSAGEVVELLDSLWTAIRTSPDGVPVCPKERWFKSWRFRVAIGSIAAGLLTIGGLTGYIVSTKQAGLDLTNFASTLGHAPPDDASPAPAAVWRGNPGAIWSIAYSPKEPIAAVAVEDGSVRLFDTKENRAIATLNAHRGVVWVASFSPDGEKLVTGGDDHNLRIWHPQRPDALVERTYPGPVRAIAWAADGQRVFIGDRKGGIHVLLVGSGEDIADADHGAALYALVLSPDGSTLASVGSDKSIRLWNPDTLQQRLVLSGHAGPLYTAAFSPDGRRIVAAGWGPEIVVWDLASGNRIHSWNGHSMDVWAAAFSPDGRWLATASQDGRIHLWGADDYQRKTTFHGSPTAYHSLVFRDETTISAGGRNGEALTWTIPPQLLAKPPSKDD